MCNPRKNATERSKAIACDRSLHAARTFAPALCNPALFKQVCVRRLFLLLYLFIASSCIVEVSIAAGAPPTDLYEAALRGDETAVRLLLRQKIDVDAKFTNLRATALLAAAQNGHLTIVRLLLAKGAAIEARLASGETALMLASGEGHIDIVQELLNKHAVVDARADSGETALYYASYSGHADVVQLLLSRGAEVNAQTVDGTTALMAAAFKGQPDVVQALLGKGADPALRRKDGGSAFDAAQAGGSKDVVLALDEQRVKGLPQIEKEGWVEILGYSHTETDLSTNKESTSGSTKYFVLRCEDKKDYVLRFEHFKATNFDITPNDLHKYVISGRVEPIPPDSGLADNFRGMLRFARSLSDNRPDQRIVADFLFVESIEPKVF